jgi:hypothetical protein
MKVITTFYILVFCVYFAKAQQNIFPLAIDTPKWCMLAAASNFGEPSSYIPFDYFYEKDTLADGKNYTKLIGGFFKQPVALIRNENKKTFIRRIIPNQTPITYNSESILYDFSMNRVNDSIVVTTTSNPFMPIQNALRIIKFVSSDSIVFNGTPRRRVQLKYYEPNRPTFERTMTWIEGFGNLENPFHDCLLIFHVLVGTMGIDIKRQRVYQDSTIANGCTPKRVSVYNLIAANISIYPNPVIEQLNIDLSKTIELNFAKITIHDLIGKLVYQQQIEDWNTPLSIDMNNLNQGMYIVSLHTQNKRLFSKKIVKSN